MGMSEFPNGAALVFGGSGGIGRHVAQAFAEAGTAVAITYRSNTAVADEVAARARAAGVEASTHAVDVTDPAQVGHCLDAVIARHSRIHTMVWAAGPLVHQHYISKIPLEQWRKAIETEAFGFFAAVQATLPHFRDAGGGSFVHLGSAGDTRWPEKDALSVAPKAINEALVKGIAREEGRYNIRANSVLVGVIEAGMFLELNRKGEFSQAWKDESLKRLALKRWGQPEEIGHAAVFLASNRAAYITGQQINVSGGLGI
jgi:NAD(P)-dependent dehydrogenase (short-subunit alcohol dehydrogenase family)